MTAKSRVALVKTESYDPNLVLDRLRQALDFLGGMGAFVRPGDRVLVKPNLLAAFPPERAITTHPAVVAATLKLVREAGGIPLVGDSPSVGDLKTVAKAAGVSAVLAGHGAGLADFSQAVSVDCPSNALGKRLQLALAAVEADVIISLPKLKTHGQLYFTGAIKNQFGLVLGSEKGQFHFRFQQRQHLAELMVDINRSVKPRLAVMDAIIGMEGAGPSGGEPRQIGVLLAGADMSAVDVVACHLIGLDPETVPTIQAARRLGFGATRLAEIETGPAVLDQLRVEGFQLIEQVREVIQFAPLPKPILRWLERQWVPRPRIRLDRCTHCGNCHRGCPVAPPAIDPEAPPKRQVEDTRCIRCYCCHEFCPAKAIDLRRSRLDRALHLNRLIDQMSGGLGRLMAWLQSFEWRKS